VNLLLFNLATDADDPILGFTTGWINRLAAHYEHIDVITMRAGRLDVAPNVSVYSIGKERGYGEARRAVEFYRVLSTLLLRRRYAACFAHMQPLFALMSAPLLRPLNVPITLWYTHRQRHRTLEWATQVSRRVVTASPDSFPIATPKLRVLGHGIDPEFFRTEGEGLRTEKNAPGIPNTSIAADLLLSPQPSVLSPQYVVHVARLMPIKQQATLIRALPSVPTAHAVFVGDVPPEQGTNYRAELEALARDLGVAERVTFAGNESAEGVRAWYARAAAAVNLSPVGLFDKAALEALVMRVPTIVTNPSFDPLLGEASWRSESPEDHAGLTARLTAILALDPAERERLTSISRARTVEAHGLDGLIRRLVQVLNTGEMT
jgi:glycosyltransferase involved in cell wall biosynthesis